MRNRFPFFHSDLVCRLKEADTGSVSKRRQAHAHTRPLPAWRSPGKDRVSPDRPKPDTKAGLPRPSGFAGGSAGRRGSWHAEGSVPDST